jgi:hypothetical protein
VTSHYGRWNYQPAYGWLWCYDPVWSPAWCATAYYGGNFVWCPLDYYNRPCSYGATFVVGGIPFSIGYSSYCHSPDLYYGPCSVYPAYGDLFVNVSPSNIYCWNIYSNNYSHKYPNWGSTALYRDYNPRRVIRGIENGGAFTVAASQRARALNSELGRTEFASRVQNSSRSIRTSQVSTGRQAQVRNASLNRENSALDTGATIRRAQSRLQSLRGSDDSKPQIAEARRSRVASLERSATNASSSKLPGATSRMSSDRIRNDGNMNTVRGQGDRSASARNLTIDSPVDASLRNRGTSTARMDRKDDTTTPQLSEPKAPRERPTDRIIGRSTDDSNGNTISNPGARIRSESSSSRTLDDTRVRVNTQQNQISARTQVPDQARMREPNLPRISGGDGRNERSQSLGTIPQVPQRTRSANNAPVQTYTPEPSSGAPQSRIIGDSSRNARAQTYTPQIQAPAQQMQSPQITNSPSRNRYEVQQQVNIPQRFEAPQQRYEAPVQQQYQAPRIERSAPQVNVPQRFEAPQQRFEAPQQRSIQAAPPQPRFEAPRQVERQSIGSPSIGGGGGGSRLESRSGGGDGGGRGRGR